jgi:hypothetical protein
MKRYALFVLLISMAVIITTFPARAGKPKPPDPYPQPEAEMQAEAYPAPGQGLPGPGFYPDAPAWPDPRFNIPYCWGGFITSPGGRFEWWMSRLETTPDFNAFVFIDVVWVSDETVGYTLIMRPRGYDGTATWYSTDFFKDPGDWKVDLGRWNYEPCDIRQPNFYRLRIWMLPYTERG